MKKLFFSSLYLISTVAFSVPTNAQVYAYNKGRVTVANPYPEKESKIVNENEVNINAVRDFVKTFKNATGVKWVKDEQMASVYFEVDGVKMRSTYNARGKWEYTLKYYDESKLPTDVRHLVRSTYYEYRVNTVTEIVRNEHVLYLVKMENDTAYLTIKVDEGELSIFEKITRGK